VNQRPTFSVIVPVYHGGRFLRDALASLGALDYPPDQFEVIVAGPADDAGARRITEDAADRADSEVRYVPSTSARKASELNAACAVASGRILAFTDDDCVLPPGWLTGLEKVFGREPDAGAVGGPDELIAAESSFGLALDWVLNSFVGTGGCRRKKGLRVGTYYPKLCNMATPRRVAFQVALPTGRDGPQLFDERLSVHENVDLAHRIERSGRRIVFAPQVGVMHYRDTTFSSFTRRNMRMAAASRRLGVHRLPHGILAASALGVLALAVCAPFFAPARIVLLACAALYGAVLLASAVSAAVATRRWPALFIVPLLLVAIHLSRGIGYLLPAPAAAGS